MSQEKILGHWDKILGQIPMSQEKIFGHWDKILGHWDKILGQIPMSQEKIFGHWDNMCQNLGTNSKKFDVPTFIQNTKYKIQNTKYKIQLQNTKYNYLQNTIFTNLLCPGNINTKIGWLRTLNQ